MTTSQAKSGITRRYQAEARRQALAEEQGYRNMATLLAVFYEHHTRRYIANLFDVTPETIGNWMRIYGVKPRPRGGRNHRCH